MKPRRPPRGLETLLSWRLSADPYGSSTVGDLAEGFAHRQTQGGRAGANLWYVRQVLSLAVRGTSGRVAETRSQAGWSERMVHELATAVRSLRRRPAFTLAVCGVLAAAVAAALAAFSVTAGTFEAARWWAHEERSVLIWPEYPFSRGQLEVLRQETQSFEAVGGILRRPAVVSVTADRPLSAPGVALSVELFAALRHRPLLGRGLLAEDGEPGAEPVVVLAHGLWQRAFGGDPGVVGRTVPVNGTDRRVVGIMPPGAEQPGPGTELWLPLVLDPRDPDFWPARDLTVAAIVREGVPPEAATADVRGVLQGLARRFAFFFRPDFGLDATVVPSATRSWDAVATPLLLLLAGSALLLLVAAIDVGNLVLSRSLERGAELKVRVAVGASRWQVVRQILAESALHAGIAGLAGWALGGVVLARRLPEIFPFDALVVALPATDPAVAMFAVAMTAFAWLLVAGIPTLHFLGSTRRAVAPRARGIVAAHWLVGAQAALATVLLVTAALLVRTVDSLERLPLGFDPAAVTAIAVAPPSAPMSAAALGSRQEAIRARVAASPGVAAAGWISAVPLLDAPLTAPVNVEEAPVEVSAAPTAVSVTADPGALEALRIEVIEGRGLTDADDRNGNPVLLVNETLARTLWPGRPAVGRRIAVDPHDWTRWVTVVGVVRDVRQRDLNFRVQPAFFLPRAQAYTPTMSLVVRTAADAATAAPLVRVALAEIAPGTPAGDGRPLTTIVRDAQGIARVLTSLLGLLAVLATVLGAVGLHGSLAAWVARRRTEIGTRLALGASPRRLSASVLRTGLALTGAGVLAGSLGAIFLARAIRSLLFGVSPLDPIAFLVPALILLATGFVAAAVPALRAAAVPPAQVLRGN